MLKDKSEHEVLDLLEKQKPTRNSSKVHPHYEAIAKEVGRGRKGHNKLKPLFDQHQATHGDKSVGVSTMYKRLRAVRKLLAMSMTQIFVPGRSLNIDYAGLTLALQNGLVLYFFVAVWAYSKLIFFRATTNQKQSSWLSNIDAALQLNGVKPIFIISDNATPLFSCSNGVRKITDGYNFFLRHHDIVADPIAPGTPKQNQPAEQGVKIFCEEVYPKILQLDCTTEEEVNQHLQRIAAEINSRPLTGREESRLEAFENVEKPLCKPCNPNPFEPPVSYRSVTIGKHYRFNHEGVYYSVPMQCHWQKVKLEIHRQKIIVKLGNKVVWVHERQPKWGRHVMLAQHMPPQHRVLVEQNKQYFADWGYEKDEYIGRMMEAQYEGLCDIDFYARKQCKRIKKIFEQYDKQDLSGDFVNACFMCVEAGRANVTFLESVLKDDVVNNDSLTDAFAAFYVAKQARNQGGDHYVH